MKQLVEDTLNLTAFVLLVIITAPIYFTMKLIDWIKGR